MDTRIKDQLTGKILILDGGMGTMLQQKGLNAEDFGGPEFEGCNEVLNLTGPEIIRSIHEAYLRAGADIIETNSFGATRVVLAEYGLEKRDIELNKLAAGLARQAADKWSTPGKPRFVAGSMGPTIKMLSLTGGITFAELEEAYFRQASGLLDGGVDLLLLETCQDTLNVKAAGIGIGEAFAVMKKKVPIIISCSLEPSGTMLAGQDVEAFYTAIEHLKPLAVGLNCGSGAWLMTDHLRVLQQIATCAVSCYPNAGLPDEQGEYRQSPEDFAREIAEFARNGWLNIAGGCCGTSEKHIRALTEVLAEYEPRKYRAEKISRVSGLETVRPAEESRPCLIGERTNVGGSRQFRDLIAEGNYEEGAEIAGMQVKHGARIVNLCVADPGRVEIEDMVRLLSRVARKVKVPLMLDSADSGVIEAALRLSQGKAIVNSINLENGPDRLAEVVLLLQKYGAAVVVGTIDEQGMALTRESKLAVAERAYGLLVRRYGIHPGDIIFDPLTFPVGTGDANYLHSAVETIEGLRLIKDKMPQCKTILGVSNVSFGLPSAGREVLNSIFVHLCVLAGLDYAIVNTEKLPEYVSIPPAERKMAKELLLNTNDQTLKVFSDFYRGKKAAHPAEPVSQLSLEERLAGSIVRGTKTGLAKDLAEALNKYYPLEIINNILMKGMEEVGRLFDQNRLIVAEVLQSAEVMKTAVSFLEPHLRGTEAAGKGKILLATVKGDVHDIGKNLVEIILVNNSYQVINLGVKVDSMQLITACRAEKPDAVGLSGLLVKSVQQMLVTAKDLRAAGINTPLILGGAALTRKYVEEKIAPEYEGPVLYAKDAMDGLNRLNILMADKRREKEAKGMETGVPESDGRGSNVKGNNISVKNDISIEEISGDNRGSEIIGSDQTEGKGTGRKGAVFSSPVYRPESMQRQVLIDYPLARITPYLNTGQLLRRYLGVKSTSPLPENKTDRFQRLFLAYLDEIKEKKLIKANGVLAFFPAYSEGDTVRVLDPEILTETGRQEVLAEFIFPRQKLKNGLSLADFIHPKAEKTGDYLGVFALTTGLGVWEQAQELKDRGEYLKSFLLQSIALELAEAFAEHLHEKMRRLWGLREDPAPGKNNKPGSEYQGVRVSPGYANLPDLGDQKKIFRLLKPEDIGMALTESQMMDPEASITALVFSHPEAKILHLN